MDEIKGLYPWDQREDEDEKAFRAFKVWRDLPYTDGKERTKLSVARKVGRSSNIQSVPPAISRYHHDYEWAARVKPYDRYMDRRQQEAVASARDRVAASRGTTIADLESGLIQNTVGLSQLVDDFLNKTEPDTMTVREVAPIVKAMVAVHETISKLKIAQSESDGKEKPAEPLSDAELEEIFGS